ncbi:thiamine pyrophosphate-dependent enzyme [Streptomyces sp. NPDC020490]|uniref:thiamine pyrophosphate-dependent enzyme n=1 Tax=Streptomyces sp. NPDC020490 TaxID=3365078 RepID=UPI0037B1CA42
MTDGNPAAVLRVRGVTKSFGGAAALKDVDLDLYPGEIHALMGMNGAGKSTLVQILSGVHQPDGGTVEIDGHAESGLTVRRARRLGVASVPQRRELAMGLTVAENAHTLRQLAKRARDLDEAALTARRAAQERRHAAELAAITAAEAKAREARGVDPVLVAATLRGLLDGEDGIVVDETITHSRLVKRHLLTDAPDSYFYVQGGLGQGIAVALGVKLAAPRRPVVLTVGDGAFAYNPVIQSYDAAKAYGLPLLVVVFNNRVYKSMNLNHRRFYPDGAAAETGEWLGTDLHRLPRLARFAEPFGMHTETVDTADALAPALERALKAVAEGTTAVVDVLVTR